jgi:hypothetical protein
MIQQPEPRWECRIQDTQLLSQVIKWEGKDLAKQGRIRSIESNRGDGEQELKPGKVSH